MMGSAGVLALLLTGCETAVDIPAPAHTPKLALSYVLSNQLPDSLYWQSYPHRLLTVSVSQPVFDSRAVRQPVNATVELLDANGQVVERFRGRYRYYNPFTQDSTEAYYVPLNGFAGQPGQQYTLRASLPGLPSAESTIKLPVAATIASSSFVRRAAAPNDYPGSLNGRLTVIVPDNAATTDYYVATARVLDAQGRFWGPLGRDYQNQDDGSDFSVDRFVLTESYGSRPAAYADLNSNGHAITLAQNVQGYFNGYYDPNSPTMPEPAFVEVTISTINKEAYDFYQSVQRYQDSYDNPFAEPAPLASNIRNGYGLFGGATDVKYRIPIQ